jgi:hypothetical protein
MFIVNPALRFCSERASAEAALQTRISSPPSGRDFVESVSITRLPDVGPYDVSLAQKRSSAVIGRGRLRKIHDQIGALVNRSDRFAVPGPTPSATFPAKRISPPIQDTNGSITIVVEGA